MANWLTRATSLFQQLRPAPEPFDVVCDCGKRITGSRTPSYQKPDCPSCGRPVFVLPANVYPTSSKKRLSKETAARSGDKTSGLGTISEGDGPTANRRSSRSNPEAASSDRTAVETPQIHNNALLITQSRKPIVTPLRKIMGLILLLSLLTVGGLWHRYRIETARGTVSRAAEAGFAALRENNFGTAAKELQRARQAVDLLGRTDDAAQEIRRSSREATAIAGLATSSLTELLQRLLDNSDSAHNEPVRLSVAERAGWLIFDGEVIPSETNSQLYRLTTPLQCEDHVVTIEIDCPLFHQLPTDDETTSSRRVIFAAQPDKLVPSIDDPSSYVLTLNGITAFLWSNLNTYTAIGYLAFDEDSVRGTQVVLERQIAVPF